MTKSQAIVNTFSVVDSCSGGKVKAEAGTGEENSSPKKVPPFPRRKKREMPCPCRVKVVADCTALRRLQWGNTYSRRGDPTITTDSDEGFELD